MARGLLIAVVGMAAEARIIAGDGVSVVISGGRTKGLENRLEAALGGAAGGVLSFGLCGALDPTLTIA